MIRLRWTRIFLLVLCIGFSAQWSHRIRPAILGGTNMVDFGEIYYGARCVLHHHDPYDPNVALHEFQAQGGRFEPDGIGQKIAPIIIGTDVNLPTTLFLLSPLAMLPWSAAQTLWLSVTIALLLLAGYSIWSLGDATAPVLSGCLVCFALANGEQLLAVGNVAGVVVSCCVIATWCFFRERYTTVGVILLAISLALKPHDGGFVWLYFLLAGGVMRKRALQTMAVVAILGVLAAIWMTPASPHWLQGLHANHAIVSKIGGTSDPAPSGMTTGNVGSIIDLQAAISLILPDQHSYNLTTYLVIGPLILAWVFMVIRRPVTPEGSLLAIASIAVLSLLPVYHRPYDAKLLLLTVPACAMLWSQGGARRWAAFAFTITGIIATSDIPLAALVSYFKPVSISADTAAPKALVVSVVVPLSLLAMGCFYFWTYARSNSNLPSPIENDSAQRIVATATHEAA